MNWELVGIIIFSILALFILCCFWATVEAEYKKRREAKKWEQYREVSEKVSVQK